VFKDLPKNSISIGMVARFDPQHFAPRTSPAASPELELDLRAAAM
jgi:hypothetical protein